MKQIRFSHNWNDKLTGNGIFTTIRKSSITKLKYYGESVGETFEIMLHEAKISEVKLLGVWSEKFSNLNPPILMVDTGMKDIKEIYALFKKFGIKPDDMVLILVLQKVIKI